MLSHLHHCRFANLSRALVLRWLLLLSAMALLFVSAAAPAMAQGGTVVRLDPSSATVAVGATTVVNVRIENVASLAGAEIHLTYDGNLVDVTQIEAGGFPSPDFVAQNSYANGKVDYAIAQMPQQHQPVNGSGVLLKITFKGKGTGTSPLPFTSVILANSGGSSIPASSQNGSITVTDGSGTSTSTPTATATPTATTTAQPPSTALKIVPASSSVSVNASTTSKVRLENVSNLWAVDLKVTYDPTILECQASTVGTIPKPDVVAKQTCASGAAEYMVAQLAPNTPASGSGDVVSLTFKCLKTGTSTLHFERGKITDKDGLELGVGITDGQIVCGQGQVILGYHFVRLGETLSCIGRAYKVSPSAIASRNGIWNPNLLYVGTKLAIPNVPWQFSPGPTCARQFGDGPPPPPPPCRAQYQVRWGDTLFAIAWRYRTTVWAIVAANKLPSANWIYAGQWLCIP